MAPAARKVDLLIACCRTVAAAIAEAGLQATCRTAWNGIAAGLYAPTPGRLAAAGQWRKALGWGADDFVVVAVANPRAQKRLERIPEIIEQVQARLPSRAVRCIIAGEAARSSVDGTAAQAALDAALARSSVRASICQIAGSGEIGTLLCASDAFLSTSSFEGLSLAQLEALAAGLPVVATDVGGAGEIAREMRGDGAWYRRLSVDASAEDFAAALLDLPSQPRVPRLPLAFHQARMAWRVEQLYRVALSLRLRQRTRLTAPVKSAAERPGPLWIITNNFSMGGAQSSARRLLEKLQSHGITVRAFTVQEDTPTRGSARLAEQGIPVTRIPSACLRTPAEAVARILAEAATQPPAAILFWNLIASYRVLLADALPDVRIFDVSPGEMSFHSLRQYFEHPCPSSPTATAGNTGPTSPAPS